MAFLQLSSSANNSWVNFSNFIISSGRCNQTFISNM